MASIDHILFGSFHIIAAAVSVLAAVALAKRAAGFVLCGAGNAISSYNKPENAEESVKTAADSRENAGIATACDINQSSNRLVLVLLPTGLALAALELLKQLYIYFASGSGSYDWWYFPFQLCSVPMYLCSLLPLTGPKLRSAFLTFMGGYTFVSAAAALIYPEDILSAAPVMTVHGFVWHAILLFISLLIFMTGMTDVSAAGLARAALLFAVLSAIAVMINCAAEPVMQAGNTAHSYAAMFYMNPYHISPQPIVSNIQKTAGIPAGLLLYSLAVILAGSLCNVLASAISSALSKRHHRIPL